MLNQILMAQRQLNQTQITTNKYVGDIRIKKEIANNDESCMHQ